MTIVLSWIATFYFNPRGTYTLWSDNWPLGRATFNGLYWRMGLQVAIILVLSVVLHQSLRSRRTVRRIVLAVNLILAGLIASLSSFYWWFFTGLAIEVREQGFKGDGGVDPPCDAGIFCNPLTGLFWALPAIALFLDAVTTGILWWRRKQHWSIYWSIASLIIMILVTIVLLQRSSASF